MRNTIKDTFTLFKRNVEQNKSAIRQLGLDYQWYVEKKHPRCEDGKVLDAPPSATSDASSSDAPPSDAPPPDAPPSDDAIVDHTLTMMEQSHNQPTPWSIPVGPHASTHGHLLSREVFAFPYNGMGLNGVQQEVCRDTVYLYRKGKAHYTTICPRRGESICCHPDGVLFVRATDDAGNRLPMRDADAVNGKGLEKATRDALKNHAQEWHGEVKRGKKTNGKPELAARLPSASSAPTDVTSRRAYEQRTDIFPFHIRFTVFRHGRHGVETVARKVLSFLTRGCVCNDSIMCIAVAVDASEVSMGEWRIHVPGLLVDAVQSALITRALEWWVRRELIQVYCHYQDLAPILDNVRDHASGEYDYNYWEGRLRCNDAKVVPLVSTSDMIYVHRMGPDGCVDDSDLGAVLNRDERELLRYTTVRSDAVSTNFQPRECFPFSPPPVHSWPKDWRNQLLADTFRISMYIILETRMKLGEKAPSQFVRKRCNLRSPTPLDYDVYPVGFYSNYCPFAKCVHEQNGCVRFQLRAYATHTAKMKFKFSGPSFRDDDYLSEEGNGAFNALGAKGCDQISVSVYCAECNQTSDPSEYLHRIPGPHPTYKYIEEFDLLGRLMWDGATTPERPESVPLVTDVVVAERIASLVSKVAESAVKNAIKSLKRAREKEELAEQQRRRRAHV